MCGNLGNWTLVRAKGSLMSPPSMRNLVSPVNRWQLFVLYLQYAVVIRDRPHAGEVLIPIVTGRGGDQKAK